MNGMTENHLHPQTGTALKGFWFEDLLIKISWCWNPKESVGSSGPSGRQYTRQVEDLRHLNRILRFWQCIYVAREAFLTLHTPRLHAGSWILNKAYFRTLPSLLFACVQPLSPMDCRYFHHCSPAESNQSASCLGFSDAGKRTEQVNTREYFRLDLWKGFCEGSRCPHSVYPESRQGWNKSPGKKQDL